VVVQIQKIVRFENILKIAYNLAYNDKVVLFCLFMFDIINYIQKYIFEKQTLTNTNEY